MPRNILLSLASAELFRPRWSAQVLEEAERFIARKTGNDSNARDQRKRIERAFPEGIVRIATASEQRLSLPDENDRHVLAAAIKVRAQLIVTDNLRDFPNDVLAEFEMEAISADHFIADTMTLDLTRSIASIAQMRARFSHPKLTPQHLVLRCEKSGLLETASILSEHANLI